MPTCPGVFPVCHKAFLRCSPAPVVELTTLSETPEIPKALEGLSSQYVCVICFHMTT